MKGSSEFRRKLQYAVLRTLPIREYVNNTWCIPYFSSLRAHQLASYLLGDMSKNQSPCLYVKSTTLQNRSHHI
ncbi:hypothetical protein FRC03_000989 [Tulasnella sp. 419]|nr:hypothetical protein FRC03_000989 [Tulasnella sp. 419]